MEKSLSRNSQPFLFLWQVTEMLLRTLLTVTVAALEIEMEDSAYNVGENSAGKNLLNDKNAAIDVAFFTASTLYEIWNVRTKGSKVRRSLVRAKLEAKIAILRTTRHMNTATLLEEMMEKLPGENLNVN